MARLGALIAGVTILVAAVGSLVLGQIIGPGSKARVETDPTGSISVDLDKNVAVADGNPRMVYEGEQHGTLSATRMTFKMAEKAGVTDLNTEGPTNFDWTMPGPKRNGETTKRHLTGRCSQGATYQVWSEAEGKKAELVTLTGDAYCKVETLPDPDKSQQSVLTGDKIVYDMVAGTVKTLGTGKGAQLEIKLPAAEERKPAAPAPVHKGAGQ